MMKKTHHTLRTTHNDGIALVVIAALFIAASVIAAVAVERNTTTQLITRRETANDQLTRISNAIIEYGVFNKTAGKLVYPCPARTDLAISDANFGTSVNTASVQDCATVDHTSVTVLGTDVIRGMVPIQNLAQYGLSVNDAFDPWNNRIMYVVNRQQTKGGAATNTNNPTVADPITAQTYPAPDFVVMSYGRDGVGATRRESTTVSIACTNGTTKPRYENCDADTTFNITPTYTAPTAGDATYFDDLLSFYRQAEVAVPSNLYCWGTDSSGYGRLADGSTIASGAHYFYTPTLASTNVQFAKFAEVGSSSFGLLSLCALTSDGTPYCWGSNVSGQIGDGTTTNRPNPTAVNTPIKFYSLFMFRDGATDSASVCGLQRNSDGTLEGTAYCWGGNSNGGLGIGAVTNPVTTPTAIAGGLRFSLLTGGYGQVGGNASGVMPVCGLTVGGDAYCWGGPEWQMRGDGLTSNITYSPAIVLGGHKFLDLHSYPPTCGITSGADAGGAGHMYCWGFNGYATNLWGTNIDVSGVTNAAVGQVTTSVPHNISTGDRFKLRYVAGMGAVNYNYVTYIGGALSFNNGKTDFQVMAGNYDATHINLYAYGYATYLDTTAYGTYSGGGKLIPFVKATPAEVAFGSGLTFSSFVDTGNQNIMATTNTGNIYSWGSNAFAGLGDGSASTPTIITFNTVTNGASTTVTTFAAHGLANGDAILLQSYTAGLVTGVYQVASVTASTFVLKTMDGADINSSSFDPQNIWYQKLPLTCYDYTYQGSAGYCYTTPVQPLGSYTVANGSSVVAGWTNTALLTLGGATKVWGHARVGDGTTTDRATPVDTSPTYTFQKLYHAGQDAGLHNGMCAITTGNDAYCWGSNNLSGDFGNGGTAAASGPTLVSGGKKFTSLISLPYPGTDAQTVTCGITN